MGFRIKCEFFNLFTYSDTQPEGMETRQQLFCVKHQLGNFYIPKGLVRGQWKWWLRGHGGTPLVVQWLRLPALNAGGLHLIPGQGPRSHMPQLRVHMPQLKTPYDTTKVEHPLCPNWDQVQTNKYFLTVDSYTKNLKENQNRNDTVRIRQQ